MNKQQDSHVHWALNVPWNAVSHPRNDQDEPALHTAHIAAFFTRKKSSINDHENVFLLPQLDVEG